EIARLPGRIELRLVAPQSLEVIEVLAVAEDEVADPVPRGREWMRVETRQRRHAEVEGAIARLPPPQHELDEQEVHAAARRVRVEAHEVHRELGLRAGGPQVRERRGSAAGAHQGERELPQVRPRERAD